MKYLIYDKYSYPLYSDRNYTIGGSLSDDIVVPLSGKMEIEVNELDVVIHGVSYGKGQHQVFLEESMVMTLLIFDEKQYYLFTEKLIYISNRVDSSIQLAHFKEEVILDLQSEEKSIYSSGEYFLNGQRTSGKSVFQDNDSIVFASGLVISLQNQLISLESLFEITTNLLRFDVVPTDERSKEFHRSPRIILREPEDSITIASAPTEEKTRNQSLLKLIVTPLAMVIFTILGYFFTRSGGMVFMMMGMSLITIGTSVHSYFSDKKYQKEVQEQKIKDYMSYLDTKYIELASLQQEQEESLNYHYPSLSSILKMVDSIDRRIYEKTSYHFDFLYYHLGLGDIPASFRINYSDTELTKYNQEASKKVTELLSYYRTIKQVPVINKIARPMGYIGNREVVIEQVQQMMIQIATFQSYHDVQFVTIFREEELDKWNWSRWLPHTKIKATNSRGFVYNQRTRDQLLTSLYQIIKERKLDSEQENGKEKQYAPHYVLLITDMSLVLDHNIMEYISEDLSYLGIHYIFVEEVIESLSEHVATVIDYRGSQKAVLLLQEGDYLNKEIIPLSPISRDEKEDFARTLAGIHHVQTLRNAIPNSITFLEMYGVSRVEELDLLSRWSVNETYQTMAVPLGVRGRDDILYLNLHEKAHGPHGLIAGTTGSGKSELVQSYILSLAVNYHPYEVAFLLIDYKGGGMANLFAKLPHVVGTITNLDGNQANRALVSIKAELKKRQRIFLENDVNHINQYTKLYKEGKVSEPLPHLLIISDEFAELKANQPEFMDELVSTARIGRSLGVKLILATQKPSGVVNDQIWSNSKFKIALKVQDVADSREVIKTPDAAEITQTGRAYLQVGNNEIYELFQSAWSGAEYDPDGRNHSQRDTTIYEITENGQYNAINKDLSGLSNKTNIKSIPTELEAIVEEAHLAFEKLNIPSVASPWLPPLKEQVFAKDLQDIQFKQYWSEQNGFQPLLVGYQDIPEKQEQSPLYFHMDQVGHILLVSSPGFGKSLFLQSLAVDAMRKHSPEDVHFYLYDFGTSGLIPLSDFPHVADYFTLDETDKILKSLRRLSEMVKERKRALAKFKATNLQQYNQLSEKRFPNIFVMVDGFDSVMDAPFSDHFYDVLNVIARDGVSLGIFLVVSLSRLNAMRIQLQANFKTKISLFLFDNSDLTSIIGRSNILLEEIKGRAVTKLDDIVQFQVTLPYVSDDYARYILEVSEEVSAMRDAFKGKEPVGIPMLPEKVLVENIDLAQKDFVFGLDSEWVLPVGFSFDKPFLMAAEGPSALNHYYKVLDFHLKCLKDQFDVAILDHNEKIPNQFFEAAKRFTNSLEVSDVLGTIVKDLKERLASPQDSYQKWIILIPDLAATAMSANITENDLKLLLIEGPKHGVLPVFIGHYQDLVNNSYDSTIKLMLQLVDQVFLGVRISDQNHTRYPYIMNEPALKPNQGYVLYPEGYEFVQLMEV